MLRRYIVFVVACVIALGNLALLLGVQAERDYQLRGYVDATRTQALPFRVPRLGVNAELFQYNTEDELRQQLDLMLQANMHWVRQFAYWDQIQPSTTQFVWDDWDRLAEIVADYPQLELVVVLMNSPAWASSSDISTAPPQDPETFGIFAQSFAQRYGGVVDYYQLWDEPNLQAAWGNSDPQPAEYAALLAAGYSAINDADSSATILAAGLAPNIERSGQNISDVLYIEALYQLGADAYFDAAAAKPYGFHTEPTDRAISLDTLNFSRAIALREVMLAYDDAHTALWASNWGWNTLPNEWSGSPSIWGAVTSEQQIDYTIGALARAEREWPWLGGMILQQWQPNAPPDDPRWGFALINQQDQPTPLWQALRELPSDDAATNGLYDPLTLYARYSGVWTFGALGADIGWLEPSDSQLEFDFHGTDIALLLREDDYFAFLYPRIDGQQANATPRDANGNAYLLLRSDTANPEHNLVPVARNLPDDRHTLQITTDFGRDQWALAGYAVSSGDLEAPYRNQIAILQLSMLFSSSLFMTALLRLPLTHITRRSKRALEALTYTYQLGVGVVTSVALMFGMLSMFGNLLPDIVRREVFQYSAALALSGGLVLFNPALWLVLVSLTILFVLIYVRIEIGLALVILWVPFFLFPVELYIFSFPMAELVLLITFSAFIARQLVTWGYNRQVAISLYRHDWVLRPNAVDYAMIAWGVVAVLSLLWTERLDPALTELRTLIIEPLLFYAMVRSVADRQILRRLVVALLAAASIVCVIGLALYITGSGVITAEGGTRRLASVYGSPNNVGLLLGRCIPFLLAIWLYKHEQRPKSFAILVILLMSLTALLTQSVGALVLGIPAGVATVLVLRFGKQAIGLLVMLGFVGLLSFGLLATVSPRLGNLLDISTGTTFIRLRGWQSSVDMLSDHPVTGLGLDQFLYEFRGHYIKPDAIFDPDLSHPHNILLDFWIRLGLPGVIVLVALQIAFWKRIKIHFAQSNPDERWLIAGASGAMMALVAHGLVDNSIYVVDLSLIFALLMAIAASSHLPHSSL